MIALLRGLHVLAVALWFGSVVFFTIVGAMIFPAFATESRKEANERPAWLPVSPLYERPSPGPGFPDPLRLEQGSRAGGIAVSAIFPVYYGLQVCCGAVALLTAFLLARGPDGGAHGWRSALAVVALVTALAGWWLEGEVSRLRAERNDRTDALLAMESPTAEDIEIARAARAEFGKWHGYSLVQNFTTLALVAGLTLLVPSLCRGPSVRQGSVG